MVVNDGACTSHIPIRLTRCVVLTGTPIRSHLERLLHSKETCVSCNTFFFSYTYKTKKKEKKEKMIKNHRRSVPQDLRNPIALNIRMSYYYYYYSVNVFCPFRKRPPKPYPLTTGTTTPIRFVPHVCLIEFV